MITCWGFIFLSKNFYIKKEEEEEEEEEEEPFEDDLLF